MSLCGKRERERERETVRKGGGATEPQHSKALLRFEIISLHIIKSPITVMAIGLPCVLIHESESSYICSWQITVVHLSSNAA